MLVPRAACHELLLLPWAEGTPSALGGGFSRLEAPGYLFPADHDADCYIIPSKVLPFFNSLTILLMMVGR